jgi:hypothetical protein
MGLGSSALMPRLEGVPLEHVIAGEDPRAILLARALTELDLARAADWQHNVSRYLAVTLERWIRAHGGDLVREQFSLHATLRNNPGPYANEDFDAQRLFLAVEADAAGYLVMGPTLEMLERVHPQLPVTFYHLMMGGMRGCVPIYDYQDALDRIEVWKECIEGDQDPEPYELPDVEACLPSTMRREPLDAEGVRGLASGLTTDGLRQLILSALELDGASRRFEAPVISEQSREPLMDCNPPLPALLVCFKRSDAVEAVFDEERQVWLEAEPEPAFLAEVDPSDPSSIRQAFDALAAFCETLAAASRLMKLLPGN